MQEIWETHVGANYQLYIRRDNTMSKDKISRKFHLGNIGEWLALTETPLRKAQLATAEALKAHWEISDTDAMVSMTDVANAVNTALAWVMFAQDCVGGEIHADDLPPDTAKFLDEDLPAMYVCNSCASEFGESTPVKPGDACPMCDEGQIESNSPF